MASSTVSVSLGPVVAVHHWLTAVGAAGAGVAAAVASVRPDPAEAGNEVDGAGAGCAAVEFGLGETAWARD